MNGLKRVLIVGIVLFLVGCNSGTNSVYMEPIQQPMKLWAPNKLRIGQVCENVVIFLKPGYQNRVVKIDSNDKISVNPSTCIVEIDPKYELNYCTVSIVGAAAGIATITVSSDGYQSQTAQILIESTQK